MPYRPKDELDRIALEALKDITDGLRPSEQAYVLAAMVAGHAAMLKLIDL